MTSTCVTKCLTDCDEYSLTQTVTTEDAIGVRAAWFVRFWPAGINVCAEFCVEGLATAGDRRDVAAQVAKGIAALERGDGEPISIIEDARGGGALTLEGGGLEVTCATKDGSVLRTCLPVAHPVNGDILRSIAKLCE